MIYLERAYNEHYPWLLLLRVRLSGIPFVLQRGFDSWSDGSTFRQPRATRIE